MTAEENIDIDRLIKTRPEWRQFYPLVNQTNFMTIDHLLARCLDNEITDKYSDFRLRKVDVLEKRVDMEKVRKMLLDPNVEKHMTTMVPQKDDNPFFKITDFHYFDSVCLSPRNIKTFRVFVNVEFRNGRKMCQERRERSVLEDSYSNTLGDYIKSRKGYTNFTIEREMDALKVTKLYPTESFSIGFVYDNRVPCAVMTNMFIRACETFYPQLLPLTYFWHSVMSEVWLEDHSRRFFHHKWMSIEKVTLLVIFFLQHCQLIPLIMRETDVFIPYNITWKHIEKWDKGEPFFDKDYYSAKRREISESPFFNKSVGEMFAALINFYIVTLPLGEWAIELDRGVVGVVEHVKDVPIYSILQWTCLLDPVVRDKLDIFRKIMSTIRQFLSETKRSMVVSFELCKIRFGIQSENRVLWEADDWHKRIKYEYSHEDDDASSSRTFTQEEYDAAQQLKKNQSEQDDKRVDQAAPKQEVPAPPESTKKNAPVATKKLQWHKKNGNKKKNKRYL